MSDAIVIRNQVIDAVKAGQTVDTSIFSKFGKDISFFHRKQLSLGTSVIPTTEFFTENVDNLTSNLGKGGAVSAPFLAKAVSMSIWIKGAVTLAKLYDLIETMKGSRYYHLRDNDRVIDFSTECLFEIDQVVAGNTDTANAAVGIKTKMKPVNGSLVFVPDNIFKGYFDAPALAASLTVEVTPQIHGLILR